ncbi:MAG: PAS domain-containing sensor histidine kinase [Candidatus Thorarchaeota archaeon]|nr:PAS domain-containing sensor histidine kinase [Candidatus Thorarchaeota archaeon]
MGERKSPQDNRIDDSAGETHGSDGGTPIRSGQWREFFEDAPLYFYLISNEGTILDVNATALEALEYRKDDLLGKPLSTLYPPQEHQKMVILFNKWKRDGFLKEEEIEVIAKSGKTRKVALSASSVRDAEGNPLFSLSVQRDITEQTKIQQEQATQRAELELYASLVQHDFGNDLQVMTSLVESLKDRPIAKAGGIATAIASLAAVTERMTTLLNALRIPNQSKAETVHDMLSRVGQLARTIHKGMEIDVELPPAAADIRIGRFRLLETCFVNLLRNAVEFAGEHARVKITVSHHPNRLEFRVSDNGPGVSESVREKLFHRGVTTNSGGLGLYLTRQILETYGGSIVLEDGDRGEGAVFRLKLPLKTLASSE